MNSYHPLILNFFLFLVLSGCTRVREKIPDQQQPSAYDADVAFLSRYAPVTTLTDSKGKSKVAVMGALQARVMTSTSGSQSYGWINKALFESGDTSTHMNAFGGEERFWLGPEGGQFAIFFEKGKAFTLDNWHTPALIDLEPFDLVSSTTGSATFSKSSSITNYSGATFDIRITRKISVLEPEDIFQQLGLVPDTAVKVVAYQSINVLQNTGKAPWSKKTGLLSVWLLGMFNPSPSMTIVIPFEKGPENTLGTIVNDDYFGKVPPERLKVADGTIYFRGDGQYRSKIGLSPSRAKDILGSYEDETQTLTLVRYNKPNGVTDYVNSKWEFQSSPYNGDVVNSYNDGPPAPGARPLGPFYELETSSPVKELQPGDSLTHIQTTFHLQGSEELMNAISMKTLGVSVSEVRDAFGGPDK